MGKYIWGLTVLSLGVVAGVFAVTAWSDCLQGSTALCVAASDGDPARVASVVLWLLAMIVVFGALLVRDLRAFAAIGLAALLLSNPITDPGLFFLGWDTADVMPFTGVIPAVVTVAVGVLLIVGARRARTSTPVAPTPFIPVPVS